MRGLHIVLIGSGGREHALAREFALSRMVSRLTIASGQKLFASSEGLLRGCKALAAQRAKSEFPPLHVELLSGDLAAPFDTLFDQVAKGPQVDLMVIGPEQPLADGLADRARSLGIAVFGPSREAAMLESSKVFAKEIMLAAQVRTARSIKVASVSDVERATAAGGGAANFRTPYVLKANGLCAGKGVSLHPTREELLQQAKLLFDDRVLGEAGALALIEEFTPGVEMSHLVLVSGTHSMALPPARDHKRLLDEDLGPNTGGMGVIAPIAIGAPMLREIESTIVKPVLAELSRRRIDYRGVLYFGLMLTPDGPSVLEFNTRFGDPEAQALLPLFKDSDTVVRTLMHVAQAEPLPAPNDVFESARSTAVLVLASEGYPERPIAGSQIEGLSPDGTLLKAVEVSPEQECYVLHAGSELRQDGKWVTRGGRVLNVISTSALSIEDALDRAYRVAEKIRWSGRQLRMDIGRTSQQNPFKDT